MNIRTNTTSKTPKRVKEWSPRDHLSRSSSNRAITKTKRDPKPRNEYQTRVTPKPKIPNGLLLSKHHFPIIISSKPNIKTARYPRFGYTSGRTNTFRGHSPPNKLQKSDFFKNPREKMVYVVITWWFWFVWGVRVVQIARGLYQKIDREKMVKIMVLLLMLEWRWWCYWVIRGGGDGCVFKREREWKLVKCVGDGVCCVETTGTISCN